MIKRLLGELSALGVHHGYGLLSCVQIAAYNFHLGLLHPEPFWLEPKVYSARCEADVLMSSPTPVSNNCSCLGFNKAACSRSSGLLSPRVVNDVILPLVPGASG